MMRPTAHTPFPTRCLPILGYLFAITLLLALPSSSSPLHNNQKQSSVHAATKQPQGQQISLSTSHLQLTFPIEDVSYMIELKMEQASASFSFPGGRLLVATVQGESDYRDAMSRFKHEEHSRREDEISISPPPELSLQQPLSKKDAHAALAHTLRSVHDLAKVSVPDLADGAVAAKIVTPFLEGLTVEEIREDCEVAELSCVV